MAWYEMKSAGLPSGLQNNMDSVLNKKFGTSTTYAPETWPAEVNLLGPLPIKTASGAIASFSDGADDVPISDCKFSFSPKQASGTPSPSNPLAISGWQGINIAHCKKNRFNKNDTTSDGYVDNKYLNDSGSKIDYSACYISPYIKILPSTDYVISGFSGTNLAFCFYDKDKAFLSATKYGNGTEKSVTSDASAVYVRLSVEKANVDTLQFEEGTTATTYEAYIAETKSVTWTEQGTIYGGYVTPDKVVATHKISIIDENSGVIKANAENCFYLNDFFDVEDTNETCVCNVYTKANNRTSISTVQSNNPDYSFCRITSNYTKRLAIKDSRYSTIEDYNTWLSQNPVQIVQELATPIEYDITALNLATYYGDNNFWSEGDTASVDYRADIALALAALQGNRSLGLMTARPDPEEPEEEPEEPEER